MLFQLTEELIFPPPAYAEKDGLVAYGGDLSMGRILLAYKNGLFPWYNEGEPILWWSPDPRCVLYPEKLKVSKSMRQLLKKGLFNVTINKDFEAVIDNCGAIPREGQDGTWITEAMKNAYINLHQEGFAFSVEVWDKEVLVGGLYGLWIGDCFFGESMFAHKSNASKFGFITFVQYLETMGVKMIDCQTTTNHLLSLGAEEIPRDLFLNQLKELVA